MTPIQGLRVALCIAALTLAGDRVRAEGAGGEERELDTVEQQIEISKAAQDRIATEIAAALREHEAVSARLVAISQKIQAQEASISESEAELDRLAKEQVMLMANLGEKQDVLSELLAGLQLLEQNPPPALVVEPNDVLAALRGAMMFGTIVPELRAEAHMLVKELARLEDLQSGIRTRKQELADGISRLETARTDLGRLIGQKKELVERGTANLSAERTRVEDLAKKAKTLKQLMASLAGQRKLSEENQARKAAVEVERKRQEELQRRPRMVFAEAMGRLGYPAQGQILRHFGDPDGLGGTALGLMIATRAGAQVTAPADGEVEFAGVFRSYGQVLILNPGGGYRVLLSGLENITAVTGEFLRAGEPVGQMGGSPASVTLLGDVVEDGRPVLYIEFRNSTEAIDSGPWWIGGMKEARG